MYQDLLEMERKLNWTMMRKKVEIEDALARVQPVRLLGSPHFMMALYNLDMCRRHGRFEYS